MFLATVGSLVFLKVRICFRLCLYMALFPWQLDTQTSTRTTIRCCLKCVPAWKMSRVTALCTWVSRRSRAALFIWPCHLPCTSLSRNLHHRSSSLLQVETCIWVQQSFSPQSVFPWSLVMWVHPLMLQKREVAGQIVPVMHLMSYFLDE